MPNQSCFIIDPLSMIPFAQASQEILTTFIDRIYKMSRFSEEFSEQEIDFLEKAMRINLQNPQQLFKTITNQKEETLDGKECLKIDKENKECDTSEHAVFIEEDEVMSDDLDEEEKQEYHHQSYYNLTNQTISLQEQSKPHNQSLAKSQSKKLDTSSFIEDSQDSYSMYLQMANQTRSLAKKHCKFHISGLYPDKKKSKKASKQFQQISLPVLLIKNRQNYQEYVLSSCQAFLRIGEVSQAFSDLKASQLTNNHRDIDQTHL